MHKPPRTDAFALARARSKKRIRKCSIVAIIPFFLAICLKLNSRSMRGYRIDPFFSAPTPPGREEFWKRTEESSCFNIDSVCNWKGGWFYKPIRGDIVTQYQPGVQYLGKLTYRYHGEREIRVDEGIQVSVSSNLHGLYDDRACSLSSTPIHLVAQSLYNEMMCEFYLRTILGLNRWMRDYPQRSSDDMQIYVHFIENNDLFEGHRLFLSGLPNNNKFESFATLMPRDDTCRCYGKLVFCGYQVENASSVKYNASHAFLGSEFDQEAISNRLDLIGSTRLDRIDSTGSARSDQILSLNMIKNSELKSRNHLLMSI